METVYIVCDKKTDPREVVNAFLYGDEDQKCSLNNRSFRTLENARNCYKMVLNKDSFKIVEITVAARELGIDSDA
jgi:uncharacterized protein YfkK (UPF0435 family)